VKKWVFLTRRSFIANLLSFLFGLLLPDRSGAFLRGIEMDELFQRHFREMSEDEKRAIIARLEEKYRKKYGRTIKVKTTPAVEETEFGYALNLSKCIGCRRCVYACVKENNLSRYPHQIHYIRVLRFKKGSMNFEESEHYYNPRTVPEQGYYYVPVQCQQCRRPPCVRVCPVKATWTEKDGIVVVDYNWCIGCRYCMAACPYRGRLFNWSDPGVPPEEINPNTHYLGNRPRMRNVVEKCHFCIQRVREGKYPACVEACPVGARKFGNLLDPQSEIRLIIETKRVFRLKEDLGTEPRFYYFFHD
jgi:Fe-S-cluster-containing dehydrogenase component